MLQFSVHYNLKVIHALSSKYQTIRKLGYFYVYSEKFWIYLEMFIAWHWVSQIVWFCVATYNEFATLYACSLWSAYYEVHWLLHFHASNPMFQHEWLCEVETELWNEICSEKLEIYGSLSFKDTDKFMCF